MKSENIVAAQSEYTAVVTVCMYVLDGRYYSSTVVAPTTVVTVVVFFTSTDRASTIPSNIRGCQSGTYIYYMVC